MTISMSVLIFLVGVALLFDFLNGLHDAANSIATVVATRVLSPVWAVVWAAFFNFTAYFVFGTAVAKTVGAGIVDASIIDPRVIFGALVGAIVWNVITWVRGIPSSSSHALIGGLLGAGICKAGLDPIVWPGVIKTVAAIFISPAIGLLLALLLVLVVAWTSLKLTPLGVDKRYRKLQLISAAMYSLGHGGNDAQKTMGIITALLYSQGLLGEQFAVPLWVAISCYAAIALGTMSGGWRIVHTMGVEDHPPDPGAGLRGRNRRRDHAVRRYPFRRPRLHHPHHHRRDHRRRRGTAVDRGTLGGREQHRVRVVRDDPGSGWDCGAGILVGRGVSLIKVLPVYGEGDRQSREGAGREVVARGSPPPSALRAATSP